MGAALADHEARERGAAAWAGLAIPPEHAEFIGVAAAAKAAGRPAEIAVYAADHGWTVPDTPIYDKAEAERAWSRLLALFATL